MKKLYKKDMIVFAKIFLAYLFAVTYLMLLSSSDKNDCNSCKEACSRQEPQYEWRCLEQSCIECMEK